MARKAKKKVEEPPPAEDAEDGDVTEEESVLDGDDGDVQIDSDSEDGAINIVDKGSGDEDEGDAVEESKKAANGGEKKSKKKDKEGTKKNQPKKKTEATMIPFMDTFYQLSSEDSTKDRSVAARDLIRHCFLTEQGVNHKDAAYALTRLMNGVCTGRAASRQGFASCLSSFLRVAYSSSLNDSGDVNVMEGILKEDDYALQLKQDMKDDGLSNTAMVVRQKLLATTQILSTEKSNEKKGQTKNRYGGKVKGIEERDHAFGRLFGILAIVRSGILGSKGFPSEVIESYTKDLIDLYHYKPWMREPSAHAVVELMTSLDAQSNPDLIATITNNVIVPTLFLSKSKDDRASWLKTLTAEQIAVGIHLQQPIYGDIKKDYPLDEPLVTVESFPALSEALASTSSVVHPRCHLVWSSLWIYLTEEAKTQGYRQLRSSEEFPLLIEMVIKHVVVDRLLGKGDESAGPTNERRSLALQIVCVLSGSSDLNILLPSSLIGSVLCPDVVTRVFVNVLCAGGGMGKKKPKKGAAEHHLKPLTFQVLSDLINHCCEDIDIERRMAFAKAFLLAEPRFDTKTKTLAVSSLLMLQDDGAEMSDESESKRATLWQHYLSFLEEEIVSAKSLQDATSNIELMYKFAKQDLNRTPANEARRVVRFFMSGAFFDCTGLSNPSDTKLLSSKKKKKGNANTPVTSPPQELSSGLRIKEILEANGVVSIPHPVRVIMSARFYSLLSDFISVMNSQNHVGNRSNASNAGGSKPESIYRTFTEISGMFSLLETSGAKKFLRPTASMETDDASDTEDPLVASRDSLQQVQNIVNNALVKECDGSGDEDILRAKAVFTTGCMSLMMSLHLQLNSCGSPDADENEEDEDDDDVVESVHEYISDLADCVNGLCGVIDDESSFKKNDDDENPLATMTGLLVNILSSPVGGEESGTTDPIQASASKLIREAVKLAWSGIISVMNGLCGKNKHLKGLVDEDVMSILIESVCGETSMEDGVEGEEEESIEGSDASEEDLDASAVFVDASEAGMDLEEAEDGNSEDSKEHERTDAANYEDRDVELDPTKLENLLLEDSDAEMSDDGVHGILEHHAGADKALAQLIKLKQDARKASQTERERIELCNRLRCAGLLDNFFSATVLRSGWLPIEAVLGSIVPILRARKSLAKRIQASASSNVLQKSLGEKKALMDRLSALVKDKISKYRCSEDSSSEDLALKAASDIYDEMNRSLNAAHCSCCSVALIAALRCIPNIEDCSKVNDIYIMAIDDWSTRKASKIHSSVFDDLVHRMPSLAPIVLMGPLIKAARSAHSPFLKCESIKLLSAMYKHNESDSEKDTSKSAIKKHSSEVVKALKESLCDSSLQKAKHRDVVLTATKHFINYAKAQDEGILKDSELCPLQETVQLIGGKCKSAGMKRLCSQVSDTISALPRQGEEEKDTTQKTPKSKRKTKKSKK